MFQRGFLFGQRKKPRIPQKDSTALKKELGDWDYKSPHRLGKGVFPLTHVKALGEVMNLAEQNHLSQVDSNPNAVALSNARPSKYPVYWWDFRQNPVAPMRPCFKSLQLGCDGRDHR
ncbi:hypothetical protein [Paraburkholderia terrae]|uniref:hypothetical protein n=1 Tax=Paraburkholderia terrae TaxID=311230 RepID=UPI0020C134FA|nr:hypothetical protein [Paraburkholderia terrae]